jgi:dUTP pyrophosphatase
MPKLKTKVTLLSEKAVVPTRSHEKDTGYDITFTGVHKTVDDVIFFSTGLSLEPPSGYYFEVVPRSSISKLPLSMANGIGVIDENYRGELLIPVRIHHNMEDFSGFGIRYAQGIVSIFGSRPQTMSAVADQIMMNKPRLFQAILRKRNNCDFVVEEISETERGDGGFGSTD